MKKTIYIRIFKYIFIFFILILLDSFLLERYWVRFPEYEYHHKNIPKEFDGFKIAVLTDVHYGFLDPEFWIKWVFDSLESNKPDIIVGLGDYVKKSRSNEELTKVWPLLNKLSAKEGVFLVNGNHDHWANSKLAKSLLQKSGKSIENQFIYLKKGSAKVYLGGIGDFWENKTNSDTILKNQNKNIFRIVIAHNPDSSNMKHTERVDLFLTGHTHGGQVRIPFFNYSPVLPVNNRNFDIGFTKNKFKEDVFISAGIGWSILPVRFFCPAEVPLIILRHKKD